MVAGWTVKKEGRGPDPDWVQLKLQLSEGWMEPGLVVVAGGRRSVGPGKLTGHCTKPAPGMGQDFRKPVLEGWAHAQFAGWSMELCLGRWKRKGLLEQNKRIHTALNYLFLYLLNTSNPVCAQALCSVLFPPLCLLESPLFFEFLFGIQLVIGYFPQL